MKKHYRLVDVNNWHPGVNAIHRFRLQWNRRARMHTHQERRESFNDGDAFEITGKHVIRAARNHHNLPTKWDDGWISRDWGRSWKDYTRNRKQWGPNCDKY